MTISAERRLSPGLLSFSVVFFFSAVYFTATFIRASAKHFWYDELCTLYICRLPTFQDSWQAALHGADYNPPLFYLIHRASAALFGEGPIATRLPEICAFWLLSLCLFVVVKRRSGIALGFAAMSVPFFSGAYYYAYDARPHAIVLGFCGLSLLCWSKLEDRPRSPGWLLAFACSLQAALLTHCYAIVLIAPFTLLESLRVFRTKRINGRMWIALAVPPILAAASFVPLLRSYRKNLQSGGFSLAFPPSFAQVGEFYRNLIDPSILLFFLVFFLFALACRTARAETSASPADSPWSKDNLLLLALCFLAMPLYGILLGKLLHGPFFVRYFLSGVIGLSLIFGLRVNGPGRPRGSLVIAGLLASLMLIGMAKAVWHRVQGRPDLLVEPSVKYVLNTDPHSDLATYSLLEHAPPSLPIAIPNILDSLYLIHYWPAQRARLFPVVPSRTSIEFITSHPVFEYCRVNANPQQTYQEFFQLHQDFLLYAQSRYGFLLTELLAHGAQLRALEFDGTGSFLARIHLPRASP